MQLLLKNDPLLDIRENGTCTILEFDRLPFALRKENLAFVDFMEWASNRTLSIGRSFAKEILNTLRLSQTNRYAVCRACRGLSLEDAYWIRENGSLFLHKVGKYEIPADQILNALEIPHIHYQVSSEEQIQAYLTEERREWIEGVGDAVVNAKLFTSEDLSMVTFEEFQVFCENYGLDAYAEAEKTDREFYLKMQIADYLLNNNDRHEQNWGFFMENATGKLIGFCPLFDHDHAFSGYANVLSQTRREAITLYEAAAEAQKELGMELGSLEEMRRPRFLSEEQWEGVLERKHCLDP